MKKILIIEDEEEISRMLVKGLRKMGFEVEIEKCGEGGIHAIQHGIPDLILLDLMIPCKSGEEVCKTIRDNEDKQINSIPIIMLTAKNQEVDKIIGKVIGANLYVTKPFDWENLVDVIKGMVNVSV